MKIRKCNDYDITMDCGFSLGGKTGRGKVAIVFEEAIELRRIFMLKNIPSILSPDLFKILMEMGHGNEIVLADGNFPAASIAQRLIRLDGHGIPEILEAILKFFPLDTYVESPVGLMAVVPGDPYKPVIWDEYRKIISDSKEPFKEFEYIERFAFYERAKEAYAVIATSEIALYANIILKKGVVV